MKLTLTPTRVTRHALTVALTFALTGGSLLAGAPLTLDWSANGTTKGGAGTWDTTAGNWGTATPYNQAWVNANLDTARFDGGNYAVTLGADVTVGAISRGYSSTQYVTIAPDGGGLFSLTVDPGTPGGTTINIQRPLQIDAPVILAQNQSWQNSIIINGDMSGSASLTHNFGTIVLNGDNSFTVGWNTGHKLLAGGGDRILANDVTAGNWNFKRIVAGSNNLTFTGEYKVLSA